MIYIYIYTIVDNDCNNRKYDDTQNCNDIIIRIEEIGCISKGICFEPN